MGLVKDKGLPMEDRVAAGITTQVETISSLGGVPIHFYVAMDLDAVEELVDLIGGVSPMFPKISIPGEGNYWWKRVKSSTPQVYMFGPQGSSDAIGLVINRIFSCD